MRAAVYARVSTEEQADEGLSLQVQAQRGRAVALEHGADVVEIYEDDGWSGTCFERPALQRMLADLDDLDLVVVWKLDRLSRSVRDWANMMDMFAQHECGLISVTEQFDMTTAVGRAMMGMMAVWAELFVDILRENVRAAFQYRAQSGQHHGTAPYGYENRDGSLVVVPEEAEVVRRIFENYVAGDSMVDICHRSQRENWRPPRSARTWHWRTIGHMLRNPTYMGLVRFNGETYEGQHEPIVSPDLWRRAHERLQVRRSRGGAKHVSLTGLYRCGVCGGRMGRVRSGPITQPQKYYRYSCDVRTCVPPERRHEPVSISVYPADTAVRIWTRRLLTAVLPEAIQKAVAQDASGREAERERLERELASVEERLRFYHQAVAEGTLPADMLHELAQPLVTRRNQLRRLCAVTRGDQMALPEWAVGLNEDGVEYVFRRTAPEQQVEMLRQLFEAVEVYPGRRLVFKHRHLLPDLHVRLPRLVREGNAAILERAVEEGLQMWVGTNKGYSCPSRARPASRSRG